MLVIDASSVCDICFEDFTVDDVESAKTPSSITCGHVICASCIRGFAENRCPFCRKSFAKARVTKLRVEHAPPRRPESRSREKAPPCGCSGKFKGKPDAKDEGVHTRINAAASPPPTKATDEHDVEARELLAELWNAFYEVPPGPRYCDALKKAQRWLADPSHSDKALAASVGTLLGHDVLLGYWKDGYHAENRERITWENRFSEVCISNTAYHERV
ncbi:hypothetical protein PUNSTDRAFT_47305 [Punctularia strigosozonata HHB-11173 SS5]|uniref:RING-type domain-containing protein n=1 Tax=Punctularia strigosozonata (strain HHB-11173) TaxID=741275 RepID=R7S327_PUNST|nr:uncharacterized protein PUNSTDRAFT_47305 [Punctularia strigosozonata HHB-11173 SS5]EIN04633.1 hypothetical protein PUNSTDRAFT_47305 [Punctularia strigosozonata HHB-11173 SS5]